MALSVNYADGTLQIININREIAEHSVEKTRLYNELALVETETETTMDYLLKQDSFLSLLGPVHTNCAVISAWKLQRGNTKLSNRYFPFLGAT